MSEPSKLVLALSDNAGMTNARLREEGAKKKESERMEMAGAITRMVVNEAMANMRAQKAELDRMAIKKQEEK